MTATTKAPEELFPRVRWARVSPHGSWFNCCFAGLHIGLDAGPTEDERAFVLSSKGERRGEARQSIDDALTWLRAQCIAALRVDVERAGHLMVTREQVEELVDAVTQFERQLTYQDGDGARVVAARKAMGLSK